MMNYKNFYYSVVFFLLSISTLLSSLADRYPVGKKLTKTDIATICDHSVPRSHWKGDRIYAGHDLGHESYLDMIKEEDLVCPVAIGNGLFAVGMLGRCKTGFYPFNYSLLCKRLARSSVVASWRFGNLKDEKDILLVHDSETGDHYEVVTKDSDTKKGKKMITSAYPVKAFNLAAFKGNDGRCSVVVGTKASVAKTKGGFAYAKDKEDISLVLSSLRCMYNRHKNKFLYSNSGITECAGHDVARVNEALSAILAIDLGDVFVYDSNDPSNSGYI